MVSWNMDLLDGRKVMLLQVREQRNQRHFGKRANEFI